MQKYYKRDVNVTWNNTTMLSSGGNQYYLLKGIATLELSKVDLGEISSFKFACQSKKVHSSIAGDILLDLNFTGQDADLADLGVGPREEKLNLAIPFKLSYNQNQEVKDVKVKDFNVYQTDPNFLLLEGVIVIKPEEDLGLRDEQKYRQISEPFITESTYLIPENLPDISQAIATESSVTILSKYKDGNSLNLNCMKDVRFLYFNSKGQGERFFITRSLEQFTHQVDLNNQENPVKPSLVPTNIKTTIINPEKVKVEVWLSLLDKAKTKKIVQDKENLEIEDRQEIEDKQEKAELSSPQTSSHKATRPEADEAKTNEPTASKKKSKSPVKNKKSKKSPKVKKEERNKIDTNQEVIDEERLDEERLDEERLNEEGVNEKAENKKQEKKDQANKKEKKKEVNDSLEEKQEESVQKKTRTSRSKAQFKRMSRKERLSQHMRGLKNDLQQQNEYNDAYTVKINSSKKNEE